MELAQCFCPIAGFGITGEESFGSIITDLYFCVFFYQLRQDISSYELYASFGFPIKNTSTSSGVLLTPSIKAMKPELLRPE